MNYVLNIAKNSVCIYHYDIDNVEQLLYLVLSDM